MGDGELLLEGHVGGGEALVVDEEGLDVAVVGGDAVFEEGGGGGRGGRVRDAVVAEEARVVD